jgi:hypothetical protein
MTQKPSRTSTLPLFNQHHLMYVMVLIRTPSDNVVHLTATVSDLNLPSNIIKDDQMGVYIDEMD